MGFIRRLRTEGKGGRMNIEEHERIYHWKSMASRKDRSMWLLFWNGKAFCGG